MWLCVVQFSNSQRNPRAANRSRSFHSDLPRSGAGARSAANPHAACDAAGTGNGTTAPPTRARRGKPWIQTRSGLRVTAPVPDPTEVDIAIQNVSLSELTKPPYKASISFQKVLYTPGTRTERARQSYVAQVDFVLRDHVPNEFVRVNPLGLQVSYFRVDQAFEEPRR